MRGVCEHARRLVYDNNVGVFVDDIQGDLLGAHRRAPRMIDRDLDEIIGTQPVANVFVASVHFAATGLDDFAEIHFAQSAEMVEQKIFEPPLRGIAWDDDLNSFLHAENLNRKKDATKARTKPRPSSFVHSWLIHPTIS